MDNSATEEKKTPASKVDKNLSGETVIFCRKYVLSMEKNVIDENLCFGREESVFS
jgi:hypothetical protein